MLTSQDLSALFAAKSPSSTRSNPAAVLSAIPAGSLCILSHPTPSSSELVSNLENDGDDKRLKVNALDVYCPNPRCQCVVMRSGVAVFEIASRAPMPPWTDSSDNDNNNGVDLSDDEASSVDRDTIWWKVTDAMHFDNIGVSKKMPSSNSQFLSCADCDVGPLGESDGALFWVKADRVRYL